MVQAHHVAIIGGTIWGNRGAEAMLVTTVAQIRQRNPEAELYLFSYLPKSDKKLLTDTSIHILDARPLALVLGHLPSALVVSFFKLFGITLPDAVVPASIRALRKCSILLDVSGISFADGREKFLPFNILIMLPAILLGIPVVKLAQAVGSFKNPINRFVSRIFLHRCYRLNARGKVTAQFIEDLGIPSDKWQLSADVAFLYLPEYSLSDENAEKIAALEQKLQALKNSGKVLIGLMPSSLVFEKSEKQGIDYPGQFVSLIESLNEDFHYILIPNATREGTNKPRNNDLYIIDIIQSRLKQRLPSNQADHITSIDFDLNTGGSRRLIHLCDLTITSRFHGMVSSLSLKIPVIVIGWSHKYSEVLEMFNLEQFAIDFSNPDLNVAQLVHSMLDQKENIQIDIDHSLTRVRALAIQQFDDIESLIL